MSAGRRINARVQSTTLQYHTEFCMFLQTPDGIIRKKHWRAVIEAESQHFYNMKVAFKLTPDHLDPKYYQKMNVPMDFYVSILFNYIYQFS